MKSATMFSALHKSKQLYLITLDRVGDYLDLVRVEAKIKSRDMAIRVASAVVALFFTFLVTIFFGLAVIVSFWDSPYRALAAWAVVILYAVIAGVCLNLSLKHFRSPPMSTMLRHELQRDLDIIKESL
ncbi:phage holin family protein [Noviherbaspirillum massiliense]|uniref:phage holin family protein n=1 Tax=Noviherbaspirillum massiliense TaxID=1465823 RepID=UPI0009DA5B13|nr:phage holin family protein [Noviherbaspirillum massiliense]